jgi:hypothetical protein
MANHSERRLSCAPRQELGVRPLSPLFPAQPIKSAQPFGELTATKRGNPMSKNKEILEKCESCYSLIVYLYGYCPVCNGTGFVKKKVKASLLSEDHDYASRRKKGSSPRMQAGSDNHGHQLRSVWVSNLDLKRSRLMVLSSGGSYGYPDASNAVWFPKDWSRITIVVAVYRSR